LLFLPTIHALAEDGPTDADLKAGYCLNVNRDRDSQSLSCNQATSNPEFDKLCHEEQNNVQRLKDYLSARGYVFGPRDPTPILIAGSRGDADFKDCNTFASHPTPGRNYQSRRRVLALVLNHARSQAHAPE